MQWKRTRSSQSKIMLHLVFVTKYRRKVFTDEILRECEDIFRYECKKIGIDLIEFGGETDHAHLLLQIPPTANIASIVKQLKGASLSVIRDYIENQDRPSQSITMLEPGRYLTAHWHYDGGSDGIEESLNHHKKVEAFFSNEAVI